MSNKTQLQTNNTKLDTLITRVNTAKDTAASLPDAGGGSGGGSVETCTVTITCTTATGYDNLQHYAASCLIDGEIVTTTLADEVNPSGYDDVIVPATYTHTINNVIVGSSLTLLHIAPDASYAISSSSNTYIVSSFHNLINTVYSNLCFTVFQVNDSATITVSV